MNRQANKIELHYFFRDNTHTMNAFVRNECEKEFLNVFKEVILSLDLEIDLESEAFQKGGLKEIWSFLGANGIQLTLIVAILGLIFSRVPVDNKELIKLQIENLELDNELKKEKLKEIKNKVHAQEELTEEALEHIVQVLESNNKIILYRSNFYKKLIYYPKVTKLTTQILNEYNQPIEKKKTVERLHFDKFILRSDNISPIIDDDATIDIISPVLIKGNFSWKGYYNREIINFEMNDQIFRNSVLNKEIEFKNGTAIKCVLHQNRRINEAGILKVYQYKVITVVKIITGKDYIETEQGRKHKRNKILEDSQLKFDFQ